MTGMANDSVHTDSTQKVFATLRDDLRRGDFFSSVGREFNELQEFMLDEQRKKRLHEMGAVRRWLYTAWWLLKSMFFKLTPARRILLVAGIVLVYASRTITFNSDRIVLGNDTGILGGLCILFVLMLELKDKLVAHKELEAGRAVQQALMPVRTPDIRGWRAWLFTRSANEVGGDLIDFIKIDDEKVGIALGDVAGKGLPAALLMAKLQASLRALLHDTTSLSELGEKLNRVFFRDSLRSIFSSLVYAELQPHSGSVRLLNAGHLPPVIVRHTGTETLPKGGPALGIMPEARYADFAVTLQKDDLLCIFSDGVTEQQNMAGEFFGERRVVEQLVPLAALTVEEIGERLVASVDGFAGTAQRHDDLSIVLIKRTEKS